MNCPTVLSIVPVVHMLCDTFYTLMRGRSCATCSDHYHHLLYITAAHRCLIDHIGQHIFTDCNATISVRNTDAQVPRRQLGMRGSFNPSFSCSPLGPLPPFPIPEWSIIAIESEVVHAQSVASRYYVPWVTGHQCRLNIIRNGGQEGLSCSRSQVLRWHPTI